MTTMQKVLFICVHNSARSQMAEESSAEAAARLWRGRRGSGRRHGCERQRQGQEPREERSANHLRHAVRIKRAKRRFNEELAPPFMKPVSCDADPNQT